jgi:hypothetical protein
MSKKYNVSTLGEVIQQAWAEPSLAVAKTMVKDHVVSTQIKSKDLIIQNLERIGTKGKLDLYLANSLLAFEGYRV